MKSFSIRKIAGVFFALFAIFLANSNSFAQSAYADLIIINAEIRTMDDAKPHAGAAAVREGKFIAVGTNREILKLKNEKTNVIDAGGKLVIPGFNDAHVHFINIGNQFASLDLRGVSSPAALAEQIRRYAGFLPEGSWMLGSGWEPEDWSAKKAEYKALIDELAPKHPFFIYHADAKRALANAAALRLGKIKESEEAFRTGVLTDLPLAKVRAAVPKPSVNRLAQAAETASRYAALLGVTSVQDVSADDNLEIYKKLAAEGKLKTRIYDCSGLFKWNGAANRNIRRADDSDEMARGGCLKGFSDGDAEMSNALFEKVLAADKAGWQIALHAIGSAANDIVLTVFEKVIKTNGIRDRRFRAEHAYGFRPIDLERFSRSKIVASMQPHLFFGGRSVYRKMLDSGAVLAFGSDASITDFDPLLGVFAAVGAKTSGSRSTEALTVEEAVRAYTLGSAYAEFQENVKGSITAGKYADFIVLSEDIFQIDPQDIPKVKILTTVVGGTVVYEANAAGN